MVKIQASRLKPHFFIATVRGLLAGAGRISGRLASEMIICIYREYVCIYMCVCVYLNIIYYICYIYICVYIYMYYICIYSYNI
jgi:hypothetical protein